MKIDYIVSTICLDSVKAETVECFELAKWALAKEGVAFYWNTPHGDGKARARSIAASKFLTHTEANYLLFVDSDILFTPKNMLRIFDDMKNGYDLIGGLFAVRGGTQASSYGINGKLILDGKIHEFEYIASGFMGITRKLLEKIRDETPLPLLHPRDIKFFPFFEEREFAEREGEGIFLSEDYDFCEKARKVGIKPYIDTSIQLGHLGSYVYSLHDIVKHQEESKAKEVIENQQRLKNLRQDIADFTNTDIEEVNRRLLYTRANFAKLWGERTGNIEDFYKNNTEALYEDANFNLSNEYAPGKLVPLTKTLNEKVVDIGCGIGTAAIMLAEQGCEVTGYDINEYTISFCNYLKEKYSFPITFTTKFPDLSKFDTVVAIDTLEHIEDLRGFIKMLGERMKVGDRLYHNEPTKENLCIETHHPQHFDHTEMIDTYLKEAGFSKKNDVWATKL